MWRPGRDFVPPLTQGLHFSIVCYPFCYLSIPVGLDSSVSILSSLDAYAGRFPFETFLALNYCLTLVYNLINFHLWNARARLFPFRFLIVHFSPTLSLHTKQGVRAFIIFGVSSSHRRARESEVSSSLRRAHISHS
jgi:hypothetical protein